MHTTRTYYERLYRGLKKLAKNKIQLVDILTIDESQPEFLELIHSEEREVLLDAIQRNQDNVSAIKLIIIIENIKVHLLGTELVHLSLLMTN